MGCLEAHFVCGFPWHLTLGERFELTGAARYYEGTWGCHPAAELSGWLSCIMVTGPCACVLRCSEGLHLLLGKVDHLRSADPLRYSSKHVGYWILGAPRRRI